MTILNDLFTGVERETWEVKLRNWIMYCGKLKKKLQESSVQSSNTKLLTKVFFVFLLLEDSISRYVSKLDNSDCVPENVRKQQKLMSNFF